LAVTEPDAPPEQGFADALREALDSHFPRKKEEGEEEDLPPEKQPKSLRDAAEKTRTVFRERRRERELALRGSKK
jgi:hypothetical protein